MVNEFHCYWGSGEGIKASKGCFYKQVGWWSNKEGFGPGKGGGMVIGVSVGRMEPNRRNGAWGGLRGWTVLWWDCFCLSKTK